MWTSSDEEDEEEGGLGAGNKDGSLSQMSDVGVVKTRTLEERLAEGAAHAIDVGGSQDTDKQPEVRPRHRATYEVATSPQERSPRSSREGSPASSREGSSASPRGGSPASSQGGLPQRKKRKTADRVLVVDQQLDSIYAEIMLPPGSSFPFLCAGEHCERTEAEGCVLKMHPVSYLCDDDLQEVANELGVIRRAGPEGARFVLFKKLALSLFGPLTTRDRRKLPTCIEVKVRSLYPSLAGNGYVGFKK
jgi:hypothetical protein